MAQQGCGASVRHVPINKVLRQLTNLKLIHESI
jgi:hypothetical protein